MNFFRNTKPRPQNAGFFYCTFDSLTQFIEYLEMHLRKLLFSFVILDLLLMAACSNPNTSSDVFGDGQIPAGATITGVADPNQRLSIALGLQRSQRALKQYIDAVLQPNSMRYQQNRSVQSLAGEFGASLDLQNYVIEFMQRYDIQLQVDASGSFLYGNASITSLSEAFSTGFNNYSLNGVSFVAPSGTPQLPLPLQARVTEVFGLTTAPSLWFSSSRQSGSSRPSNIISDGGNPVFTGSASGCSEALSQGGFAIGQLQDAYGVTPLKERGYAGEGIHFGFLETNGFNQSDIDAYLDCFGIENATQPELISLDGNPFPLDPETFLDLEIVLSIAPRLEAVSVFQLNINSFADFVTLLSAPLNETYTNGNPVDILSVSLGVCEEFWSPGLIELAEHVLMTAAASGINIFVASGDSGSSGCFHDDGMTTTESPSYPATSQYVTAVGGSNLALNPDNSIAGQGVWNDIDFPSPYNQVLGAGGGGESNIIAQPFWQVGTGNQGGFRTIPDVVFFADVFPGYPIYFEGAWLNIGGTSASAPFLAASVALLTQIARANNIVIDPSFMWIYSMANSPFYDSIFGDIVVGNNDLFGVGCCSAGEGYDLASGWGSMNMNEAATILLGL